MKRFGLLLMLLSIGLFVVGCEQPNADKEKEGDAETSVTDTPDAPDAQNTTTPPDAPDAPVGSDPADPPAPTKDPFN